MQTHGIAEGQLINVWRTYDTVDEETEKVVSTYEVLKRIPIQRLHVGDLVQTGTSGRAKIIAFRDLGYHHVIEIHHSGEGGPLICTKDYYVATFDVENNSKNISYIRANLLNIRKDNLGFPTPTGDISLVHINKIKEIGEENIFQLELDHKSSMICSGVIVKSL